MSYPQDGVPVQPQPGYPPAGHDQPRYDQPRYDQPRYGQPRYGQPRYGQPGYPQANYAPPPQGYPYPGYAPAAYQMAAFGPPPPSNIGWAVAALLCFWPLAIPAFIASNKIQSAWLMGDLMTAQKASADTKKYGVIALCIGAGLLLVWLILFLTILSSFPHFR